jgi:hypothetical protein
LSRKKEVQGPSKSDPSIKIRKLMEQAEEYEDKLSERGIVASDYLRSPKEIWDR